MLEQDLPLVVRDLAKTFGDRHAVQGISFTVRRGEILGLVGPNGAGKTTTLRILSGILRPTCGEVSVHGHDLQQRPVAARSHLAFVPDSPRPYDYLTVREHLEFVALAYGRRPGEDVDLLLQRFGLAERRDDLAAALSRGMRQKLAICCAFLHHPQVLLLDEPLGGLDPLGIREMREAISERADLGAAVVISSHQLELVERLCHRLLILRDGRVLQDGTLEQIRSSVQLQRDASLEDVFFRVTGTPA